MKNDFCLKISNMEKTYKNMAGQKTIALQNINLEVKEGEFISIIGPSGCGKSTLLKIVSGLDNPTGGKIEFNENFDLSQYIGFVFQDSVLLPWKNVYDNAVFPLEIKNLKTKENLEKLEQLLSMAGLADFKKSLPRELSGGMKQRVSIVRSLSYDPKLLLMDEPFGALDALTRDSLNIELLKIWEQTKKTILFVTHSIDEAVFLSSKVIVMSPRPGRIKEILDIDLGYPRTVEIRNNPKFIEYSKYLREVLE
ncbi:ABC transporter ATP-binding protein [Fusobacterium sp.]|uniref:ABC transporter ATP-binding protein n=1 Tax=Fusobacterium sp. TaxID=68766 RepID=UPI002E79D1DC|nr:ABC transporter ATP-binding protein [Fusobacterium sp.]MEE1475262.1 ABC transporter ATP-binding protein [Fusobacterium sp.]